MGLRKYLKIDAEYVLNSKSNLSVKELQTCVALLKENYEMHSYPLTLQELTKLIDLLIQKDPERKEEYINDLVEVKFEQDHTVFNNAQLHAAKVHTTCLNKNVQEYVNECIPSTNFDVFDRYDF